MVASKIGMVKIIIALLALISLTAATDVPDNEPDYIYKQKFLFEIVYRIEDPLMFEEYIKLGKSFVYHKDDYPGSEDYAISMDNYYKAFKYGVTLPKGEFYGASIASHQDQLKALVGFFSFAKTWDIFQRNVCWARLHANEAMFVQALTLAVLHSDRFEGLMLPTIYEIFPQYFFNSRFVYEAEKFDYNSWSQYIMYEKEYKDVMYTDYSKYFKEFNNYNYFYTKDWKMWQWWKLMGLDKQWYSVDSGEGNLKKFWMPVDYTRDIEFFNKESALSYFTEDLDWNAHWYYFNMAYYTVLDGKHFGLHNDRRGEFFAFVLRQVLARYYLERLSHGYGEIPMVSHDITVDHGYDPQLIHYSGLGFSTRSNYYETSTYGNSELYKKFANFRKRFDAIIKKGYHTLANGTTVDIRQPEAIEFIGNMMQGNADAEFGSYWLQWVYMYFADDDHSSYNYPHVMLNYETALRDPVTYMSLKKQTDHFYLFHNYIQPYTKEELSMSGVSIEDVHVSPLITYFDLFDFDVTNLMNDKMTFIDGEFVWDKTLLARQMRLNHKEFFSTFILNSDKDQKVVLRTFLAPKFDEFGQVISLSKNRNNFWELDKSVIELFKGQNIVNVSSSDYSVTVPDRTSYSSRYEQLMLNLPVDTHNSYCGFPDRLLLPRGWEGGMPMQLFFIVTPYTRNEGKYGSYYPENSCKLGSGVRHLDDYPFGYPFDREIDEYAFSVPNVLFKDVQIYHEHIFEKYYGMKYIEQFGTFNESYYNEIFYNYQVMN